MKLLKKSLSLFILGKTWYPKVFWIADYKSGVKKSKFKIADPQWLPCWYKISIKLVIVPIEYIFIHAKKDAITEKNGRMKNSKEKKEIKFEK